MGRPPGEIFDPPPDNWCRVTWGIDGRDLIATIEAPCGDYPPWVLEDLCKIVGAGEAL